MLLALALPGCLRAASKLPPAAAVLDRYIGVSGGHAAWHSKNSERVEIEGQAIDSGRVLLRAIVSKTRQGNAFSEISVPQQAQEGVYKGIAWAWSQFSGVRIKRGIERDEARRDSRMLEEAEWRELYPDSRVEAIETLAAGSLGDRRCYKVRLLPSSTQTLEWFDVASGLLIRRSTFELSPSGETPAGFTVLAWAERDGVKQPSLMEAWRGDLQYQLRVLSIVYNAESGRSALAYPPEVANYLAAAKDGQSLPNAEEIIERHIYESGGPEAYEMLKTQKVTGTLSYLSRGIEARMESFSAGGGKYYQVVDLPGMGKQEEGSDGLVSWDRSPAIGPRVKPRKSPGTLNVTLDAAGMIGWRYLLKQVRTEALERIDGRDCYRLRLVPRDGTPDLLRWYDKKSGLLYRTSLSLKTDMGSVPILMVFEEYREVAAMRWPSRIRVDASGLDMVFAADEVRLNDPIDESVFDLPEEIKKLAHERKFE